LIPYEIKKVVSHSNFTIFALEISETTGETLSRERSKVFVQKFDVPHRDFFFKQTQINQKELKNSQDIGMRKSIINIKNIEYIVHIYKYL
jgi:tRNA A22 N-methylase